MTLPSEPQRRFPDAREDVENWDRHPETAQTRSPSYRLAFNDGDFLTRDELRPVRLQLELLKTEMALAERGIPVSHTGSGNGTASTVELTWGLILAAARNLEKASANMRAGKWHQGLPAGKALGGVGQGGLRRFGRSNIPKMTCESKKI